MPAHVPQVFLSHSGDDSWEAGLLQFAIETLLKDYGVRVWTYQRDQAGDTRNVSVSLKDEVKRSCATLFLASPSTIKGGATQWMELAYSDAFGIPTFVLLHRLTFAKLKTTERGSAPFLTEGQCTLTVDWRKIVNELGNILSSKANEADGGS